MLHVLSIRSNRWSLFGQYSEETFLGTFEEVKARIAEERLACPTVTFSLKVYAGNSAWRNCNVWTRARAYRYWEKHFSGLPDYCLPQALQDALELPCQSFGEFVRPDGEIWAYEG